MTRAVTIAELGDQSVFTVDGNNNRVGIGSTQPTVKLDVDGVVVATAFTGDGAGLTGIAVTDNIVTGTAATFTGGVNVSGASNIDVTGVVTATTFSGNITGVAATFSGDVTIGGELTYEDVTNIDSVGIITAQSGVSIADSIFHTGDTDTAIRFPAANTFTVTTAGSERLRVKSDGFVGIKTSSPLAPLHVYDATNNTMARLESGDATCRLQLKDNTGEGYVLATGDNLIFANTSSITERLRITSTGGVHFNNAELIERVNIVANKLSAVPNVNLDNGMVHYYTTNETTTANPNIITTAGINTNMATGDTMSVTIMSKPNNAGYFPRISIDGRLAGITTYWNGGSAPSSAESSGVDVNTYQIIKTADETFDVLANTSNFA